MGAISEIKSAVDLLQELTKYIKKSANSDPQVIQDLEGLRGKILDAYSTEIELRQKLHELEEQLAIRKLPYDTDTATYFQLAESGDKEFFCQRCLDVERHLCRLQRLDHGYYCRACKEFYQTAAQRAADNPHAIYTGGNRNDWNGW